MKIYRFLFVLLLFTSIQVQSQQKISIEDAILKAYSSLAAENIDQLQWIKATDEYSFVKDDTLFKSNLKGKESKLIDLVELDSKTEDKLTSFPRITWQSKYDFTFRKGNSYYSVLLSSKDRRVIKVSSIKEEGANSDFHYKSSHVAYTVENNLWISSDGENLQITDNKKGVVSGQAIARYEFGIGKGTFWNSNGSVLAFYEKDESNVTTYPLVDYNTQPASLNEIRYPMAGGPGEHAAVGIYNVKKGKTLYLNIENGRKDDSFYVTNLSWGPQDKFIYIAIVNRDQNHYSLKKYDAKSGEEIATVLEERNDKYTEPEHAAIFLPNEEQFLWFSEKDGFNNLYLYNDDGKLVGQTQAQFPITSFLSFDKKGKVAFVEGTGALATENHIYKLELPSMKLRKVSKAPGSHHGKVSDSGKFLLDTYTNIDTPRHIELMNTSGKNMRPLLHSKNPLSDYKIAKPEIFELESFDGEKLWCRMIKPSNFDASKKYPVLVYTYNGPHVQLVRNSWLASAPLWMYSMAEEGYIVFSVDGRGSANRGRDFEQAIFRNVGDIEVKDQVHCTNWLKKQSYTDENRFAIHGWSYGGFMTTSLMLKQPGVFKVGVAGGPVIDWSLYEVMYTERYMDTPQSNPEGFENSKLTNYVKNLKGDLLMIHGTVDDVVLMQHNMNFLKTCVDEGVLVDFFVYPGHPHNVRGKDRVHLMKKVLGYIMERL